MNSAQVNFRHYSVDFTEDALSRFGSRYFGRKEAGKRLCRWLLHQIGDPLFNTTLSFGPSQLVSANEIFPEAALADPVADLEVWDEWRTGVRQFPYEGIYTRLNILWDQEHKTTASSSVGVIGEMFTGLFSQCYVAPLVVVRPIRRWPDFIYLGLNDRYSFVESKASVTLEEEPTSGLDTSAIGGVPEALLGEGLTDAVQELNAEPSLRVWLVFTNVVSIQPLIVNVSVLETQAPQKMRDGRVPRIPDAVVDGLARRAMMASAGEHEDEVTTLFRGVDSQATKREKEELLRRLKRIAAEKAEQVLPMAVPVGLRVQASEAIQKRIKEQKSKNFGSERIDGKRLALAKREAAEGRLASLREAYGSGNWLMMADLVPSALRKLHAEWQPDWGRANKPWGQIDDLPLWRCSSAVLGLGRREYEGRSIDQVR